MKNEKLVSFLPRGKSETGNFKKNEIAHSEHEFTVQSEKLIFQSKATYQRQTNSSKIKRKSSERFNRDCKTELMAGIRS